MQQTYLEIAQNLVLLQVERNVIKRLKFKLTNQMRHLNEFHIICRIGKLADGLISHCQNYITGQGQENLLIATKLNKKVLQYCVKLSPLLMSQIKRHFLIQFQLISFGVIARIHTLSQKLKDLLIALQQQDLNAQQIEYQTKANSERFNIDSLFQDLKMAINSKEEKQVTKSNQIEPTVEAYQEGNKILCFNHNQAEKALDDDLLVSSAEQIKAQEQLVNKKLSPSHKQTSVLDKISYVYNRLITQPQYIKEKKLVTKLQKIVGELQEIQVEQTIKEKEKIILPLSQKSNGPIKGQMKKQIKNVDRSQPISKDEVVFQPSLKKLRKTTELDNKLQRDLLKPFEKKRQISIYQQFQHKDQRSNTSRAYYQPLKASAVVNQNQVTFSKYICLF